MNQQVNQPDWSTAPTAATHWSPLNNRWYRQINDRFHHVYRGIPAGMPVYQSQHWLDQLIPRPVPTDSTRLQRFDKRRLTERTVLLGTDKSVVWLNAGTVVKVGGYVQFDPGWGEVLAIHWDSPDNVGYVTTITETKLLPLETPEEREAREQFQAMCTVLGWDPMPASYNAEVLHKLYAAGCRIPLDKIKE